MDLKKMEKLIFKITIFDNVKLMNINICTLEHTEKY